MSAPAATGRRAGSEPGARAAPACRPASPRGRPRSPPRSITSIDDQHFLARVLPYRTSTDRIGGAVLTFIDVTRLHRTETTDLLAEQRLRDAVAASEDFAVICTDSEGLVTSWNEGAMRIFGHEGRDIVGRAIDLIYTAPDRTAGVPALERGTALREGRATDERWHVRADGSTLFCSGVMTPLPRRDEGFVKIARDVSLAKGIELEHLGHADVRHEQVEVVRGQQVERGACARGRLAGEARP